MNPVSFDSLGSALHALAKPLFVGRTPPAAARTAALRRIVAHQGKPGSYAGMFAPAPEDLGGIRLFTGEIVRSRAGIGHLLGEEACRILAALPRRDRAAQAALDRAVAGMAAQLDEMERRGCIPGTYCCGTCTAGYWRNLANGLLPHADTRLCSGLAQLHRQRRDDGTWSRYPFFFTSLALTEIAPSLARPALRHAAARWRRILPRLDRRNDALSQRRAEVGRRLLVLAEA